MSKVERGIGVNLPLPCRGVGWLGLCLWAARMAADWDGHTLVEYAEDLSWRLS